MFEELQEQAERQQQLWADADIVDTYGDQHPEAFGGSWWSDSDLTVAFVDAEDHRHELHRRVGHPDRVHVVNVTRTLVHLAVVQERVEAGMEQGTGHPFRISMVGVQEDENCVVVGIDPYSQDAVDELRRRYGEAVQVQEGPVFHDLSSRE